MKPVGTSVLFTVLLLWACDLATAQTVGNCPPSLGEGLLDVGNVAASIYNNGMVSSGSLGRPNYEVPKGSGHNAVISATLQFGVEVRDQFKVAATTTGPAEFWPGPLPFSGAAPDSIHCEAFDRVWSVQREDLERYRQTGLTTNAILSWPYQVGAPVHDGDGVVGNYNLAGGDLPAILGDQTVWWVMNDRGNTHNYSRSEPIGLEIRGEAFAFGSSGILGTTTFYRYEVRNASADNLNVYAGLFLAGFSGSPFDDYAGTDTSLAMAYIYGADDEDGRFGTRPPALGITVLSAPGYPDGPPRLGASHIPVDDGGPYGWPKDATEYRHFVRGLRASGDPILEGSWGEDGPGPPTPFVFAGDPVQGASWSMVDDGLSPPFDQEAFVFLEPFELSPGESEEVVFAIVWAQGEDRFDSIIQLREGVRLLLDQKERLLTRYQGDGPTESSFVLGLTDNHPNPFSLSTRIRASIPREADVRLEVFDLLGRSVRVLQDGVLPIGEYEWEFAGSGLPPGVYFYQLSLDDYSFSKMMMLAR